MLVIICCLCLSAGEGLRLRPFPVSGVDQVEVTNAEHQPNRSNDISTPYSPTIVPTQQLKRGNQQIVKYGNLPSQSSRELNARGQFLRVTGEVMDFVSLLLVSRIPSRAPPLVSGPFAIR